MLLTAVQYNVHLLVCHTFCAFGGKIRDEDATCKRKTDIHGKIILKLTVKKEATMWNGFIWFKIRRDM